MRSFISFALLAAFFIACNNKNEVKGPNGVVYKSPQEYNQYIVDRQVEIMKDVLALGQVSQYNIDSAETMLDNTIDKVSNSIKDIEGMPAYKGDDELKNSALNSFRFYKRVFSDEYKQILSIRKKPVQTEEDEAAVQSLVGKITEDEKEFDRKFHAAQQAFAKKNNMQLEQNEMQKDIDKLKNN